ncbi:hypothetical protein AVMA1855_25035 [Acidovorax sp. SUPP1855]|uniref:hypothetical protein n=1 Tax=Acidovorax sp. SUPP1855 TaxID=431774 RepID=UPI0023DE5F53|nr:hypothetical protein [Acidovorax sp. SUPP1855]GKS87481.1 hypothetical protein AVMA1855_25035 [Acidovorax sp. SUPP1855]
MKKTSLDLDHETQMMVIAPVFTCSIAEGTHFAQGGPGERMYAILGRWLGTNYRQLTVVRVQQTSMTTWSALLSDNQAVEFNVII